MHIHLTNDAQKLFKPNTELTCIAGKRKNSLKNQRDNEKS